MTLLKKNLKSERRELMDQAIEDQIKHLNELDPDSEEFQQGVDNLDRLVRMKGYYIPDKKPSGDAWLNFAGGLLSIGAVLMFEMFGGIITTKTWPMVQRFRR